MQITTGHWTAESGRTWTAPARGAPQLVLNFGGTSQIVTIGFYSYGETCPSAGSDLSELQNQAMTVTVLSERA
jgi:phage baseplate assembly protein gpV